MRLGIQGLEVSINSYCAVRDFAPLYFISAMFEGMDGDDAVVFVENSGKELAYPFAALGECSKVLPRRRLSPVSGAGLLYGIFARRLATLSPSLAMRFGNGGRVDAYLFRDPIEIEGATARDLSNYVEVTRITPRFGRGRIHRIFELDSGAKYDAEEVLDALAGNALHSQTLEAANV
jgi:hypothetical protein